MDNHTHSHNPPRIDGDDNVLTCAQMSRIKVMIRDLQIVLRVALSGAEWGSGRGADSR